jgi:3-oxoacyl-[acyl-carrier protein] reductase
MESMDDFTGKTVVITGAASGSGKSAAELFAERGADVVGVDIDEAGLEAVMSGLPDGEHLSITADVSKNDDVVRMAEEVAAAYDSVDVLFNNAGISHESAPIEDLTEATWDEVIDANLKSAFLCTKYLLPLLRKSESASIVNNASISAIHPRPGTAPYASSNGGMISLTRQLAIELVDDGIRVNGINATATETPLLMNLLSDKEGAGYVTKEQIESSIPLGRLVQPEEVAHAALYLASDAAAMITGSFIPIEGGRTI